MIDDIDFKPASTLNPHLNTSVKPPSKHNPGPWTECQHGFTAEKIVKEIQSGNGNPCIVSRCDYHLGDRCQVQNEAMRKWKNAF